MPELFPGQCIGVRREGIDQRFEFVGAQGQLPGIEFQQLAGQQQARQIPVRALATGDQHLQSWVLEGQELVEPVVQVWRQVRREVVEDQA
ncbi:hypothetical protein D3C81_1056920 [compost metagenome]